MRCWTTTPSTVSAPPTFTASPYSNLDGTSGTVLTFGPGVSPCFAAGTHIHTRRGEVAVEDLQVGDLALIASGEARPIIWLGHRSVDCRHHPKPVDVHPVRVSADAVGPRCPQRDLLLSPDHSLFIDGMLIPVRYLLNGATIVQEPADSVSYWHVELEHHDVLLAEGLPCESYLDTGNRGAFANGGPATHAHPDFALKVWDAEACAPLVVSGPRLEAVRGKLLNRLPLLGYSLTEEPELRFLADGRGPIEQQSFGHWQCLALPDDTAVLRIASRQAVPSEIDPASIDCRRLGFALTRMRLDGEPLPLDDPRLLRGWHAPEPGFRWTDGSAELDVSGASIVELQFAPIALRYPVGRQPASQPGIMHAA